MNPRIRPRRPASIGSNQASPENSPCSAVALLLSLSMAWSPPALERRSWLVEQPGDYATQISHHTRDGTQPTAAPLLGDTHAPHGHSPRLRQVACDPHRGAAPHGIRHVFACPRKTIPSHHVAKLMAAYLAVVC